MALKLKTKSSKLKTKEKPTTKKVNGIEAATELLPAAFALKDQVKILEAQAAAIKKELTPLETGIRDLVDPELEGTEGIDLIHPDGFVLSISARQQSRTIKDTEEVVDALEEFEEGLAIKIAKFNLGDLDKYFSPEEMEVLCDIKEGNRRLTYK